MIYKCAYTKGDINLVKIVADGKEVWANTSVEIANCARNDFKDGDDLKVAYTVKNGQYIVSKMEIGKPLRDGTVAPVVTGSSEGHPCGKCGVNVKDPKYPNCYICNKGVVGSSDFAKSTTGHFCEECGANVKDAKYSKCYNCNKKNPVNSFVKQPVALSTQFSIERQNINNAVSRSLISLQGQIDINTIAEVIDMLWAKYASKLK